MSQHERRGGVGGGGKGVAPPPLHQHQQQQQKQPQHQYSYQNTFYDHGDEDVEPLTDHQHNYQSDQYSFTTPSYPYYNTQTSSSSQQQQQYQDELEQTKNELRETRQNYLNLLHSVQGVTAGQKEMDKLRNSDLVSRAHIAILEREKERFIATLASVCSSASDLSNLLVGLLLTDENGVVNHDLNIDDDDGDDDLGGGDGGSINSASMGGSTYQPLKRLEKVIRKVAEYHVLCISRSDHDEMIQRVEQQLQQSKLDLEMVNSELINTKRKLELSEMTIRNERKSIEHLNEELAVREDRIAQGLELEQELEMLRLQHNEIMPDLQKLESKVERVSGQFDKRRTENETTIIELKQKLAHVELERDMSRKTLERVVAENRQFKSHVEQWERVGTKIYQEVNNMSNIGTTTTTTTSQPNTMPNIDIGQFAPTILKNVHTIINKEQSKNRIVSKNMEALVDTIWESINLPHTPLLNNLKNNVNIIQNGNVNLNGIGGNGGNGESFQQNLEFLKSVIKQTIIDMFESTYRNQSKKIDFLIKQNNELKKLLQ